MTDDEIEIALGIMDALGLRPEFEKVCQGKTTVDEFERATVKVFCEECEKTERWWMDNATS